MTGHQGRGARPPGRDAGDALSWGTQPGVPGNPQAATWSQQRAKGGGGHTGPKQHRQRMAVSPEHPNLGSKAHSVTKGNPSLLKAQQMKAEVRLGEPDTERGGWSRSTIGICGLGLLVLCPRNAPGGS